MRIMSHTNRLWSYILFRLPAHHTSVYVGCRALQRDAHQPVSASVLHVHPPHPHTEPALSDLPAVLRGHALHAALPPGGQRLGRHRIQVKTVFKINMHMGNFCTQHTKSRDPLCPLKLCCRLRRVPLRGPGLAPARSAHPRTQLHRLRSFFHWRLRRQSAFPARHGAGERSAGVLRCRRRATGGQIHRARAQTGGEHFLSRRCSV